MRGNSTSHKSFLEKEIGRGFSPYENFPDKQPMFESYTYHVFEDVGAVILEFLTFPSNL